MDLRGGLDGPITSGQEVCQNRSGNGNHALDGARSAVEIASCTTAGARCAGQVRLGAEMAKPEVDWLVTVNGVEVGKVNHEVMEEIRQAVRNNRGTYLAQLEELFKASMRIAMQTCKLAPAVTLMQVAFVTMASPLQLDLLFLNQAPHFVVATFVTLGYMTSGVAILGMLAFGNQFGFQDQRTVREIRAVRRYLGVPADGEVLLEPVPRHPEPPARDWKQIIRDRVQVAVKRVLQAGLKRRAAEEG